MSVEHLSCFFGLRCFKNFLSLGASEFYGIVFGQRFVEVALAHLANFAQSNDIGRFFRHTCDDFLIREHVHSFVGFVLHKVA